jgi:hypothetical protein
MKKTIFCLMAACLSLACIPNDLMATPDPSPTQTVAEAVKAEQLIKRLEEIDGIDKSSLSQRDKRALRKEVRSIDKELREISGGIYISVGALILILILLIILL